MKLYIIKVLPIAIMLTALNAFGQLENANWYFGESGAGLNFTSAVNVLTDGETEQINSYSATVSDENGDLLFYTDGRSVWNKYHNKMPNGDGSLNGFFNPVVIVPFPNNSDKYYIFTIGTNIYNQMDDYYYSVVNMDSNNPMGIVESGSLNVAMNILPYYDEVEDFKTVIERPNNMVVSKHADGESYWLILNPFDKFFAIKIDSNGISNNPVESDANGDYQATSPNSSMSGMSISPNMDKVAYFTYFNGLGFYNIQLSIFAFNNDTGELTLDLDSNLGLMYNGYATEFSGNGNYLYLLAKDDSTPQTFYTYQLDMNNISNPPILLGSSVATHNNNILKPTLRRAIDGKIYIPSGTNNKLGVINNPNGFGTGCNYVDAQIDLGEGIAETLPPNIPIHEISCIDSLAITETVNMGNNVIEEAENYIIASNIVESGAYAEYHAGISVTLSSGFHAESGSLFRAYILGCENNNINLRNANQNNKDEIETNEDNLIKLFPNPTNSFATLSSSNNIYSWELSNQYAKTFGKKVLKRNIKKDKIDLMGLPKGIYFLKINFLSGETITKSIIKN